MQPAVPFFQPGDDLVVNIRWVLRSTAQTSNEKPGDKRDERDTAESDQNQPYSALRFDDRPQVDTADRDEEHDVDKSIGQPAPYPGEDPGRSPDPVWSGIEVEENHSVHKARVPLFDLRRPRREVDVRLDPGARPDGDDPQALFFGGYSGHVEFTEPVDLLEDPVRLLDPVEPLRDLYRHRSLVAPRARPPPVI